MIGATQGPFIHPGRNLRVTLTAGEVARTGGFNLEPDGNRIDITFNSLFGDPVALSPRTATAVSASVLELPFPDTATELGLTLAGPVEVRVHVGDRLVAHIAANDLVALPPANDVLGLVEGVMPRQTVRAALSARGDLWVPLRFGGEPGMPMPGCEGNFLLPAPIIVGSATTEGVLTRGVDPLHRIRRVQGYLGDVVINGTNFYGMYYPEKIRPVHMAGTTAVSICRMNDATDLVLRMRGSRAWARSRRSVMRGAVRDSAPLVLRLESAPAIPGRTSATGEPLDSFGNVCDATPANRR